MTTGRKGEKYYNVVWIKFFVESVKVG